MILTVASYGSSKINYLYKIPNKIKNIRNIKIVSKKKYMKSVKESQVVMCHKKMYKTF